MSIGCPECGSDIYYAVSDDRSDKGYKNILEICTHCGYLKTYVDYLDLDVS